MLLGIAGVEATVAARDKTGGLSVGRTPKQLAHDCSSPGGARAAALVAGFVQSRGIEKQRPRLGGVGKYAGYCVLVPGLGAVAGPLLLPFVLTGSAHSDRKCAARQRELLDSLLSTRFKAPHALQGSAGVPIS